MRLIVEHLGGQKMDWSMSRKALEDEYKPGSSSFGKTPLQRIDAYKKAVVSSDPKERKKAISGPEDYHFAQGCFDFERPESWDGLLKTPVGSSDDQAEDRKLLGLLNDGDARKNWRDRNKQESKYGGYILNPHRQNFCKELQKRSIAVLSQSDHVENLNACSQPSFEERPIRQLDQDLEPVLQQLIRIPKGHAESLNRLKKKLGQ